MAIPMYRVRAVWSGGPGGPALSTYYFKITTPGSAADAATVAGRVRGAFDVLKTLWPSSMTIQVSSTVDQILDEDGSLTGSYGIATPAVVTGTGVGGFGPPQVQPALLLLTNTFIAGRRVQGRSFLGPIIASQTNVPTPSAGVNTAIDAFGVALITASPPAATAPAVVWARPKPGRNGQACDITSSTHSLKFFTLRSRRD